MKKLLLTAAMAAVVSVAVLAPQSAKAVDGTITFKGQVLAQTCTVDTIAYQSNGTLTTPDNRTINLPNVLATALNAAGSTAGQTGFQIQIAGCDPGLKSVTTTFSGSGIDVTNHVLSNTGTSSAVEVQLLDSSQNAIPLAATYAMPAVNLTSGAATLQYYAQYYSKNGSAGAGSVTSTVSFTMSYQ
ncbi:type 1 fimbrial protein [Dyella solisilvae]|uniref:Type 1 fimbrial protein n=1 Tax=Dyella solisilvae TaxID=1920168 RepID=A0A370K3K2_9GAMM|nr:fimbrial protein [Dyella solisilvae]RDI97222.1 type 1 fimbrial protein [Dyella solisilvae]